MAKKKGAESKEAVVVDNYDIRSIRWNGTVCKIVYEVQKPSGKEDELSLKSYDAPQPAFQECLDELKQHALELIEVTGKAWAKSLRVIGVNFSGGEAMIVCTKKLSCGKPFNFNTPTLPMDSGEDGKAHCLSGDCVDVLEKLRDQAREYLNGGRLQPSLFNE